MNLSLVSRFALVSVAGLCGMSAFGKPHREYGAPRYGMAGCGAGAIIVHEYSKEAQLLAQTFNGSLLQMSAISSGTSHCNENRFQASEKHVFLENNLRDLSKEAARGQGPRLVAFAEVLGCPSAPGSRFYAVAKERHGDLFGTEEPVAVLASFQDVLQADRELVRTCKRLG